MADEQQPDQPPDPPAEPGRSGADETREMPPVAAGDETEPMPSVSRWSGRAGVPPPDALVVREAVPVEEEAAEDRRWWLPVVLGLVALVLLALLGTGLWLILRGSDDSGPVTPVTPALTASATPAEPSPSTPGTPSPALTTPPSPTERAQVVVPRLVGLDSDTAQSTLDRLGLTTRLTSRPDPVAQPGTVLEVDPAEGSVVPAGTRVTLVIASAPPSPAELSPALPTPRLPTPTLPTPTLTR